MKNLVRAGPLALALALALPAGRSAAQAPAPAATPSAPVMPATSPAAAPPAVTLPPNAPFDTSRPEIQSFIDLVVTRDKLDRAQVTALLSKAVQQPKIIDAMTRPAERVVPWWEYRARFLTEQRIRQGVEFWQQHRERLEKAALDTGVDPAYVVAIIGVETFYGRVTGSWRVLDSLSTLAFDYPPRAEFFRSELAQFLLLAREEKIDPETALGSYAGAMGPPQFIASSYRRFAVDGDGDGTRSLFSDWDDVIASVANYFAVHGWQRNGPVMAEATADPGVMATLDPRNLALSDTPASLRARGIGFTADVPDDAAAILMPAEQQDGPRVRIGFANFEVITRYNRSIRYAMAVHDLAESITARAFAPEA